MAFQTAGRQEEALDELAMRADVTEQGPPPRPTEAGVQWKELRERAEAAGDRVLCARSALALANLALEDLLSRGENAAAAEAIPAFQEAANLYVAAGMAGRDAAVNATLGRTLLRYGLVDGVSLLTKAVELWEAAGDAGGVDGARRDLHVWYLARGEADSAEAVYQAVVASSRIQSDLTRPTDTVASALKAYSQADFAAAHAMAEAALGDAVAPGQEASLLLQQASALLGSGARPEALECAERAVALLSPAAPCVMLGDALFHMGMAKGTQEAVRSLWQKAAQNDEACGLWVSAADRLMNLAQFLGQGHGTAREVDLLYGQARGFLANGCDRKTLIARGNLAQRQGQIAFFQRDFAACGQWYTEAEALFRATDQAADLAFTLSQQGLMLFQIAHDNQDPALWRAAVQRFDEALEGFSRLGLRSEQARLHYLVASATLEESWLEKDSSRESNHRISEARLEAAALLLDQMRGGRREAEITRAQNSREDFAKEQEKIYDLGFRLHLQVLQQTDCALLWLERMKARALLDALADGSADLPIPMDADPDLAARAIELEQEREKLVSSPGPVPPGLRLQKLNAELVKVWETMARRPETSAYAAMRLGRPVGWSDLRRGLRKECARPEAEGRNIVAVHFAWPFRTDPKQRINLIVSRADWDYPRAATLDIDPGNLMNFARSCFGGASDMRSPLRSYLRTVGGDHQWQQNFAPLLAPLAEWTNQGDIICLIPHGPLHSVPLHALHLDGIPLAERNAVFYAPSAAVLLHCLNRVPNREMRDSGGRAPAAIFGCSLASGFLPTLPRAVEEAKFVAGQPWLDPGAGPVLDENVTGENLRSFWPAASVIHFAGHGLESPVAWENGIVLAEGERISALDFVRIKLQADLVTLSSCRTGRSRRSEGDELLGLVPALLRAGVSSVLASQWEVRERPTEMLMGRFYELVYGHERKNKAEALRLAVTKVREEFPLLADWAPFALFGDWK
jgi:hypothetical protein